MKLKTTLRRTALIFIFALFFYQNSNAQCFEIESILVDACDGNTNTEGRNEMVRFKVGNAPLNTNNLVVSWPNNPWEGLIQNATTTAKVANLNADILDAGGCGQLIQPTGGVLPANATVIIVTSYNFDVTSNSFGALTENIYIVFQNANTTSGHFANYGASATRTLTMSFGACRDTVSYDRSLLINQSGQNAAGDGATVNFTPSGTATYVNNGCIAPIPPFTVDAGNSSLSTCAGNAVTLNATAQGQQTVLWSAPSGTFSAPGSLTTTYTPSASSAGSVVVLTLTATNSCGAQVTDIINLTVTNGTVPNFNVTPIQLCSGSTAPILSTTSPNGIIGTWNPATISNTAPGTYTFTPNNGQCASPVSLSVTITPRIVPNFSTVLALCAGNTAPLLNTTSPNGITGTWSPATVSNMASANYTFTPNTGQCAATATLRVNVATATIVPDFIAGPITLCSGSTAPILNSTSPNGITGTWSPATVSNTVAATYTFTPNAGQCATAVTLRVNITTATIVPNFNTVATICFGDVAPILNTISPNGIVGTWSPAIVSNTASATYTFTPNAGQCATTATFQVTVTNATNVPNFDTTPITICTGSTAPILSTTAPNGITGTWSPAIVSNTIGGNYTFTPNQGQCATTVTLSVTITSGITPDFATVLSLCKGNTAPALSPISPNGITGTWSPATINTASNGSYVFTPNAGQCATAMTLNVTIASIQAKITESCIDSHFTLEVIPVATSYNANTANYTWKNESGQTVGNNDEMFDVYTYVSSLANATYPMIFTVTVNDNGCETTENFTVYNIACNIPKGISPNGDGANDEFDLTGFNVRKLEIFNRYGKRVNSFTNYRKEWHGQADNGNELPDGTYYYVIEREGVKTVSGWVQINRQRN